MTSILNTTLWIVLFLPVIVPLFIGRTWQDRILWAFAGLFLSFIGLALFLFYNVYRDSKEPGLTN